MNVPNLSDSVDSEARKLHREQRCWEVAKDDWELLMIALAMMKDLSRRVVEKRAEDQTLRSRQRMKNLKIRLTRRIQGGSVEIRRVCCHGNSSEEWVSEYQ